MTQKQPNTIAYLIELTTQNHTEVKDRLKAVEEQVKYTNGRVNRLEQRQSNDDAVAVALEKRGAQPSPNPKSLPDIDYKTVFALLGTLATIIMLLVQHGGIK